MKRHYSLALLALLPLALSAGPRSRSQAQAIALQQAQQLGITTSSSKMKAAPRAASSSDTAEPYYIFNNGGGQGFTVVAGDDLLPDIVGYTTSGTYDAATAPAQLQSYLTAYAELSEAVARGDREALALAAEAKALRQSSGYKQVAVSPLLEKEGIHYDQEKPYNNLCPEYITGKRSATGCAATAVAMVMRYYKYPAALQTEIPAYVTETHKLSIPAIAAGATYDWDNMLPDYGDTYTDLQATAVATLMYHVGASLRMDYSSSSGACVTPIRLSTYFGYDSDLLEMISRTVTTQQQWNTLLDTELQAGRPVLYEGYSSSGGHEFVCDGADGKGLYHINWGWGGYQDGYFDITTLNPKKGGIGSGNAPDGYNRNNAIIIGIAPDNGQPDAPLFVQPLAITVYGNYQGITWQTTERTDATKSFQGQAAYWFCNANAAAFDGYVGIAIVESDGTYRVLDSQALQADGCKRDVSMSSENVGYAAATLGIDYAFPEGSTELVPVYSTDGETWQACPFYNSHSEVINCTATELTVGDSSPLEVTAQLPEGDLYTDVANTVNFTITNTGSTEYKGIVSLYTKLNDETTPTSTDLNQTIQIYVPAGETITRPVTITPTAAGTLSLWLADGNYGGSIIFSGATNVETNGTPQLELYRLLDNATEDDYETEKAYYSGYQVRAPRVEGDKAVFTARVYNAGETHKNTLTFAIWNPQNSSFTYVGRRDVTAVFPAGETVDVSIEVSPEEAGTNTIYCSVGFDKSATTTTLTVPTTQWYLYATSGGYFTKTFDECVVYVDNSGSGIETVETEPQTADAPIYTLDGVRLERITRPGIYIQSGRKVVIK